METEWNFRVSGLSTLCDQGGPRYDIQNGLKRHGGMVDESVPIGRTEI